ncbi:MAG: alpha/beta hydrolase, partial [Halobacteriota archaeon]
MILSSRFERYVHERLPEEFPRVVTRDVGGASSWRPWSPGGSREPAFDVRSEVPGWSDGGSPDEVVVFAHGWLADVDGALGRMALVERGLREAGYEHPVVGFTWPADQSFVGWWRGKRTARESARVLAGFLAEYASDNPRTRLRLMGNSLGAL